MASESNLVFARNIKLLRAKRSLSQEDLADLAGLDRTYIGSVERAERNITLASAEKISKALGFELWEVLSLAE